MTKPEISALIAGVLLLPLLAGCGGSDHPASAASGSPTPITRLNTSAMQIVRVKFCDLVPATAIRSALGAAPASSRTWASGDPVPDASTADVADEFGCSWTSAGGTTLRTWVFARPVTAAFGRDLAVSSGKEPGCRLVSGPEFGRPTLTQVCSEAAEAKRVRHAGLFADTWLTCEVTSNQSVAAVRRRADSWCVDVANALDTRR
jgi:hypothetical protein